MHIHHLNCSTNCPLGGRLIDGVSKGLTARFVCHCLVIETTEGLVLVDTGLGTLDVQYPLRRLSRAFLLMNNFKLRSGETAIAQLRKAGYDPRDVRHIVLTHLDFDHAGGISDFPNATVHVMAEEFRAATDRQSFWDVRRYRPVQWNDVADWKLYEPGGEGWQGFQAVRQLDGLPPEILLVSLIGHSRGHAGIAIQRPDGWLLHAGDAYVHHSEMQHDVARPRIVEYQSFLDVNRDARLNNQKQLRELANDAKTDVHIFCSHDPAELAHLQQLSSLRFT